MPPRGHPLTQPARPVLGRLFNAFAVICLVLAGATGLAAAQDQASSLPAGDLLIGTRVAPPFAMKAEDGSWYFSGCEQECTDAEGFSDYPCPTVRAIEEALS